MVPHSPIATVPCFTRGAAAAQRARPPRPSPRLTQYPSGGLPTGRRLPASPAISASHGRSPTTVASGSLWQRKPPSAWNNLLPPPSPNPVSCKMKPPPLQRGPKTHRPEPPSAALPARPLGYLRMPEAPVLQVRTNPRPGPAAPVDTRRSQQTLPTGPSDV